MYKIDFHLPVHVHFIGIGGISMSGLAEILHTKNFTISGSDAKASKITKHLEDLGIQVQYGQRASNITEDIEYVVHTAAVKPDNLEYMRAAELGLKILDRAELLGQLMGHYKNSIGVSGTHGKTTATSMLSLILLEGGFDPTISNGGMLKQIDGNIRIGSSDYFVVESCEYTNSFLKFEPKHEIILNIEEDHLDFFKDIHEIRRSFRMFAEKLPKDGTLVINGEIEQYEDITASLPCRVLTYGIYNTPSENSPFKQYDYAAENITFNEWGYGSYDLLKNGSSLCRIELSVIGLHNVSNSLAAIALSHTLGVSTAAIQKALRSFTGTERRFEKKGEIGGVTIIDDYAHHPSEITATLTGAKAYPHKSLWCVFQPHTYTRTKALLPDFAKSLSLADHVILTDIYAAREKNPGDISSIDLLNELEKLGTSVYYFPCFDDVENFLLQELNPGELLITMGAGDVYLIGESLLGQ